MRLRPPPSAQGRRIDVEIAHAQTRLRARCGDRFRRLRRFRPPQPRFYARDEFPRSERFGDVIVGANFEADDPVDLGAARGKQQDRRTRVAGADAAAEVEAVEMRHHHVEQAQGGRLFDKGAPRRFAILGDDAIQPFQRQQIDQTGAQIDVVFSDEDFHVDSGSALMVAVAQRPGSVPLSEKPPPLARVNSCTIARPMPCDGLTDRVVRRRRAEIAHGESQHAVAPIDGNLDRPRRIFARIIDEIDQDALEGDRVETQADCSRATQLAMGARGGQQFFIARKDFLRERAGVHCAFLRRLAPRFAAENRLARQLVEAVDFLRQHLAITVEFRRAGGFAGDEFGVEL